MKSYLALIKIDIKLALRQRSVIFFNYLFPLTFFFIFAQAFHAEQGAVITQVVTMVAVIGILGNGLFGAGMRAVQERENNVLRRYKVTPISPAPILVASMATGLILYMPYMLLMLTIAKFWYGMAVPVHLIAVLLFIAVGVIAFRAIGLILASVANSVQESTILIQMFYMPMLFLSGASFPITMFPAWLLMVTQFIPSTYLVSGLQGIMLRNETLVQNWAAVGALVLTMLVATFISMKLFRWEKDEKIKSSSKLWLLAVILPFVLLGTYQAYSKENVVKTKVLSRDLRRSRTLLIRNARIFTGDGKVIENGALLVKDGKIADIFEGTIPDPKSLSAEAVEAAGKTILPGLIDVHVHLGSPGGFYASDKDYDADKYIQRELAAYLYSGVTAVKSVGDPLDTALKIRARTNSGERLGTEFFLCGPMFTTEGGHGTEYIKYVPEYARQMAERQLVRLPKSADEARQQVDELKKTGVDGIKAILEAGAAGMLFHRMDVAVLRAVAAEARAQNLPIAVHTGDSRDVADALAAQADSIEHGSMRDRVPEALFAQMAKNGVAYDPTLSVAEAINQFADGKTDLLKRSLVQQAAPPGLLKGTMDQISSPKLAGMRNAYKQYPTDLAIAKANLLQAWHSGVMLVTGSDAGNPLVIHGPTVQRELELWVEAGIPNDVALQAATRNAARLLRADGRFGTIRKGNEASLLIVDGNPLTDIHAIEAISSVMFKGEHVDRTDLFEP